MTDQYGGHFGKREDGARQDNTDAHYEGWGQSGNLFVGQGNGPGSGFGLQKSFGRYARAYTVQFAVMAPGGVYDCTADIMLSVAGQTILRRVSVGNATSITGLCQALNVQIYDTTQVPTLAAGSEYAVICTVTPGTRGSNALPPTLKGIASSGTIANKGIGAQILASGTNVGYSVPNNCGVVSVEISAVNKTLVGYDGTLDIEVDFLDNGGTFLVKGFTIVEPTYPVFVDVPANCGKIVIFNNSLTAQEASVALTWGIDG